MKATLPLIAVGAALVLSACSKSPEQPAAQPSSSGDVEPARPSPTPVAEASETVPAPSGSVEASPEPTATATATATATTTAGEIPSAILGRWGLVPKDCTSKLGDAKGLLVVSARQLKFYEAVARLGTVKNRTDESIRAAFAFSGEGQAWTLDVSLALQNGGKTLTRRDTGKDALPGPQRYTRCS